MLNTVCKSFLSSVNAASVIREKMESLCVMSACWANVEGNNNNTLLGKRIVPILLETILLEI